MELLTEQLKNFVRHKYAWPGGYPMFAFCRDGAVLSHDAVRDNYRIIRQAMVRGNDPQWDIVAIDINWEDQGMCCAHTGTKIEAAYGDDNQ